MSEPSITAPGLPAGVQIVETRTQTAEPVTSSFQTDTAGMSASQAAAAQYVDANRAAVVQRSSDHILQRNVRQAAMHAAGSGPAPDWLKVSEDGGGQQAQATTPAPDMPVISPTERIELAARASFVNNLPHDVATDALDFCEVAELPAAVSRVVIDRLAKHHSGGWTEAVTEEEAQDLHAEAIRAFGSEDKAIAESTLARKYLTSVSPELLALVDSKNLSIGFDPYVIGQLAMMARSKGIR